MRFFLYLIDLKDKYKATIVVRYCEVAIVISDKDLRIILPEIKRDITQERGQLSNKIKIIKMCTLNRA